MTNHAHLEDDYEAMFRTCFDAFISPEQATVLLELWAFRERPDNEAFEKEHADADGNS